MEGEFGLEGLGGGGGREGEAVVVRLPSYLVVRLLDAVEGGEKVRIVVKGEEWAVFVGREEVVGLRELDGEENATLHEVRDSRLGVGVGVAKKMVGIDPNSPPPSSLRPSLPPLPIPRPPPPFWRMESGGGGRKKGWGPVVRVVEELVANGGALGLLSLFWRCSSTPPSLLTLYPPRFVALVAQLTARGTGGKRKLRGVVVKSHHDPSHPRFSPPTPPPPPLSTLLAFPNPPKSPPHHLLPPTTTTSTSTQSSWHPLPVRSKAWLTFIGKKRPHPSSSSSSSASSTSSSSLKMADAIAKTMGGGEEVEEEEDGSGGGGEGGGEKRVSGLLGKLVKAGREGVQGEEVVYWKSLSLPLETEAIEKLGDKVLIHPASIRIITKPPPSSPTPPTTKTPPLHVLSPPPPVVVIETEGGKKAVGGGKVIRWDPVRCGRMKEKELMRERDVVRGEKKKVLQSILNFRQRSWRARMWMASGQSGADGILLPGDGGRVVVGDHLVKMAIGRVGRRLRHRDVASSSFLSSAISNFTALQALDHQLTLLLQQRKRARRKGDRASEGGGGGGGKRRKKEEKGVEKE